MDSNQLCNYYDFLTIITHSGLLKYFDLAVSIRSVVMCSGRACWQVKKKEHDRYYHHHHLARPYQVLKAWKTNP